MIRYFNLIKNDNISQRLFSAIAFSTALAVGLLATRFVYAGRAGYFFLLWNLFLALIPYWLSLGLNQSSSFPRSIKVVIFVLWVLFFPNAPYLLTDLIHLKQRAGIPLWFDLLLLLTFAWSGLLVGLASLGNVHEMLAAAIGKAKAWAGIIALIILCGFGIYLGRFLRWNSWDALINPVPVIKASFGVLHNANAIAFTLIFSGFLMVTYLTLLSLAKANGKQQE